MIHLEKIGKTYGSQQALRDVSLSIPPRTCYGLLGPNGAGKSTLMKILAGIVLDYSGAIDVDGQNFGKNLNAIQQRIGYIPQEISLEQTLSARDHLRFFGQIYGLRGSNLQKRVNSILEMVGLAERQKDALTTYSGGMKRRINIGAALLHQPDILIMDEPTVGVDPQSRNYIFDLIRQLKSQGTTILYSSHYMEEIQLLCDELALIDEGQVIESGTISGIRQRHTEPSIYVEARGLKKEQLQSYGAVHSRQSGYVIETGDALSAIQSLSANLQKQGLDVQRLEITQSSLEDIFLELTGSSLRDTA
ncbi:ABC transporter ATP-binding protein [Salicibibacter kimchii]|uniref:ABC transporter ATP-binding protein n=2 Tax=Salicibibacter kimchii TaxID=2099786 RepID=A0A345C485_9BACI|nr:ABC transporter ATP-binding protein [Salicibibacter kimchii]